MTNAWKSSRPALAPVHACLPGNRVTAAVPEGQGRWLVASVMRCPYTPGLTTTTTTPWGNGHLAQKAQKILGTEGAKENFYKAPKLIYSVILWYSFVVQSPPAPREPLD